ncbi:MAG: efflux RND transporter permease subunit, partial [Firmicutes bacterium]|nr:efflux RND transporter permease subunit [Bacillota bacterium]
NIISGAAEGLATVLIEFTMNTDVDRAAMDVSRALDGVRHRLPREVEKPVVQKYNINEQPMLIAVLTGAQEPTQLRNLAEDRIKPVLEAVPGVGAVSVLGGAPREIHVVVDRSRLEGYGLGLNQLVNYLEAANVNVPAGSLEYPPFEYQVRTRGEFRSLAELADLPVPLPGGGSVPLREIADIRDTHAEVRELARLNGRPAVGLVVQKQTDASVVDVAAAVRAEIDRLRKQLPPGGDLLVAYDSSRFVRQSLTETQRTLLEGVATTGLVLLAFLRDWRSVAAVMTAIPTSIVATFMMIYFAGFTFNLLTLLGLTMCVGILVDDSIVVLENIHRHRYRLGKPPARAALDGRLEIGTAAVAITLSDVAVFAPIAFMTGLVGQFFRQFGLTVVFATLFSLFVSFTLTPMLAARLPHAAPRDLLQGRPALARLYRRGAAGAARVAAFYRRFLMFALRRRGLVLGAVAVAFLATMSLIPLGLIGSEFMVTPDEGSLTLNLEMPAGTSLETTDGIVRAVEARLAGLPELEYCFTTVGSGGARVAPSREPHLARIYVQLVPKGARDRSVWEVGDEIRSWGRDFPGLRLSVSEEALVVTGYPGPPVQMLVSG